MIFKTSCSFFSCRVFLCCICCSSVSCFVTKVTILVSNSQWQINIVNVPLIYLFSQQWLQLNLGCVVLKFLCFVGYSIWCPAYFILTILKPTENSYCNNWIETYTMVTKMYIMQSIEKYTHKQVKVKWTSWLHVNVSC